MNFYFQKLQVTYFRYIVLQKEHSQCKKDKPKHAKEKTIKEILKSHNPVLGTWVPEGIFRVPTELGYLETLFLLSQNISTSSWTRSTLYMILVSGDISQLLQPLLQLRSHLYSFTHSPLGKSLHGNQLWNTFLDRSVFLACYYKSLWIITFLFFITWIRFLSSAAVSKYSLAFI